jgi:hypothetical protein
MLIFTGADIRQNGQLISKEAVVYPEKISIWALLNDQTDNYARTGFFGALRPPIADAMARSTFQERFRGIAKSRTDYAVPTFVIKSKDFDGPRSPDSTPGKLLPRVEDLTFFPPNFCCFGEANWYGKINIGH